MMADDLSTGTAPLKADQPASKPATPGNGSSGAVVHSPIVIPVVKADAASIKAAEAVLGELIAERDRLHGAKNLMPDDDTRLRRVRSDVEFLTGQIKVAKLMV